jgi:hypothetical protein
MLGNNIYKSGDYYTRDRLDKDGTIFNAADVDAETFTVKLYDGSGWPSVPGCLEDKNCEQKNQVVYKGSTSNPTKVIVSGTVLALNTSNAHAAAARKGIIDAVVHAISEKITERQPEIIFTSFKAAPGSRFVTLTWKTWYEKDIKGFNLYRA